MNRFLIHTAFVLIALTSILLPANAQTEIITTVAGGGSAGLGDGGPATSASLNQPSSVVVDASGDIFIADTSNGRIREVSPNGAITTVAGNGCCGYSGDGQPATSASLSSPQSVAVDSSGNIYIADTGNNVIRKVSTSGIITTVAGKDGQVGYYGDGGPATSALLWTPSGVAVDGAGDLFIADTLNNVIRKVSASTGNISTVAGEQALENFSGDGGAATSAGLYNPTGVFVDASGNLFIADRGNNRVRKVSTSGTITTVAGNGTAGFSGDGGPATAADLYSPTSVAVDGSGNLFIAVTFSNRIREVSPGGTITTVAGEGMGFYGDGGPATSALLNRPAGVAVDASGDIFIADTGNNRIREVSESTLPPPSIKPSGVVPVYSTVTTIQPGEWVSIYGTNLGPASPATWNGNFPTSLGNTTVTIDGNAAFLWFVSSTQINLQVPDDTNTGRSVSVVVTTPVGNSTSTVNLAQFAPSFSLLDSKHVAGIIVRSNGLGAYGGGTYDILGPTGNSLGYATVAAKAGDSVQLYAVGLGPTNPVVPVGQAFSGQAATTNAVNLLINNVGVTPGFAGLSSAGLYQINLTVPSGLGTGDVPLAATVGGSQTQAGVVISLQ